MANMDFIVFFLFFFRFLVNSTITLFYFVSFIYFLLFHSNHPHPHLFFGFRSTGSHSELPRIS